MFQALRRLRQGASGRSVFKSAYEKSRRQGVHRYFCPPPPLGSDVTLHLVGVFVIVPDYARRCRTSLLIMVPINFW